MKLQNPFKLQNWRIRKFLIVVISMQLSLLGLFAIDNLGIDIPIIRPLIGFIYLSFIPGYLLLRILKLNNLSGIESFLYALGLSISINMFVGFLMNILYPILNITDKPISETPIILTMAGIVFLLCIISYFEDKNYNNLDYIDIKDVLNPQVIALSLIPFMAIFGTFLVNYYQNNLLLMSMIVVIALVALIVGFTDWISVKLYPYAIWVMAIALVLHISLFTNYIHVYDVYVEIYYANTVINSGVWDYVLRTIHGSVLSSTLFIPFIYYITDLDLTWVAKLFFPLFISFIPAGLYHIYSKFLSRKASFLSSYFFIIIMPFFIFMPFLTRQLIAQIYMLTIFMALFSSLNPFKKMILLIIFGSSLIASHPGLSILVMFMFLFTILFLKIFEMVKKGGSKAQINYIIRFALPYTVFILSLNLYIADGTFFETVVHMGNTMIQHISEFLNPEFSRGAALLIGDRTLLGNILKYLYLIVSSLIGIGLFKMIYDKLIRNTKFNTIYLGFSIFWFGILGAAVIIPFFAIMNPYRLYHLALFLLAPFSIIGASTIFILIKERLKMRNFNSNFEMKFLSVLFVSFMLLNTGFVHEISNESGLSIVLSHESMVESENINIVGSAFTTIIKTHDIFGSRWLAEYRDQDKDIFITVGWLFEYGVHMAYGGIHRQNIHSIYNHTTYIKEGYIFLSYLNIIKDIAQGSDPMGFIYFYDIAYIEHLFEDKDRIYDNGGSQILLAH